MSFSKETFAFLADLEAQNSKDWFEENRARYETHWKEPALDFISDVSGDLAVLDPALSAVAKLNKSLRRINRDVRFSKNKSPYNARLHMIFWTDGHPNRSPGLHVVLSPDGVGYGAGQFGIEPAVLGSLRQRIAGPEGDDLIAALEAAKRVGCRMDMPDLARLPRGFEAEGRRAELLRYKGYVARTFEAPTEPEVIFGAKGNPWLLEMAEALLPLIRWLEGK